MSEDCLTLNVWAPGGAGLPVMVWICGGAFLTGGTCIETYDCARLAATHDVVVVSVNYRMGALGFTWLEDGDANCGLRDQLTALEWIADNIAGFGGDPGNVTAFGESAGAGSLAHLLSSPASARLLRRCIVQSPGVDHTLMPADVESVAAALLDEIGLDAAGLRQAPWEEIVDTQEKALPGLMRSVSSLPFHPVVDGSFLPAKPSVAFREGAAADVDLLVSWTADEMRLFPNSAVEQGGTDRITRWARALIERRLGSDAGPERASELVAFYEKLLAGGERSTAADLWAALQGDGVMRLPARRLADAHASHAIGRTFSAQFDWPARGGDWERGAFHAIDLPFTFGTLDRCGWRDFLGIDELLIEAADGLAEFHMAAWAAFARDGAPADAGVWPDYELTGRSTMLLDEECRSVGDPLGEIASAWEGLWSPQGGPPA